MRHKAKLRMLMRDNSQQLNSTRACKLASPNMLLLCIDLTGPVSVCSACCGLIACLTIDKQVFFLAAHQMRVQILCGLAANCERSCRERFLAKTKANMFLAQSTLLLLLRGVVVLAEDCEDAGRRLWP